MFFRMMLEHMVRHGTLRYIDPSGREHTFGNGEAPRATLRLQSAALGRKVILDPSLFFAEAYLDGHLSFEDSTLSDFMVLAARNHDHLERRWLARLGSLLPRRARHLTQYTPVGKAWQNPAHHFDLSDPLYDLFLDHGRQYSRAYFTSPQDGLEEAQENKKRHIAAKLLLDRPGLRVLDIGSGWGGLGLYLAGTAGCQVTGVTLNTNQHEVSAERARDSGLEDHVRFLLKDYRQEQARYDRIVSVGMFEHVDRKNYLEFFAKVKALLNDDGVCLLHSIGSFGRRFEVRSLIHKSIFPGADLPTLSEVFPTVERVGLHVTDVEILRLHHAETLKAWNQRFQANRDRIAELYDERFCRMWELYLQGCEQSFHLQDLMVFQIQLSKSLTTVPLTRDYIYQREHRQAPSQVQAAE
jgi:cyclopropane-fatty-acyl-phospholipid synthase